MSRKGVTALLLIVAVFISVLVPLSVYSQSDYADRYIAFVWHFHQPVYYSAEDGMYLAPWPRLWLVKGYYPMLAYVAEVKVPVTIDITPTLLQQIMDVARGAYRDPYLEATVKDPEKLTVEDKVFILSRFFDISWDVQVKRYPRYWSLLEKRNQLLEEYNGNYTAIVGYFTYQDYLDIQVLFNLAWFNKFILENDPALKRIYEKAKNSPDASFSKGDKMLLISKQIEYANRFLALLRTLTYRGLIDVIMTPFFYPIMPLVANTSWALRSDPGIIVPPRPFAYPQDVAYQINMSKQLYREFFGPRQRLEGLWPPELALSDEIVEMLSTTGIKYTVADRILLERYLGRPPSADELYAPWLRHQVYIFFRDTGLSDWIGFEGSHVSREYGELYAASTFVNLVLGAFEAVSSNRAPIIVIALDGENPWEWYPDDGSEFVPTMYRQLKDRGVKFVTLREYVSKYAEDNHYDMVEPLPTGSWAGGSLSVWIGEWEENLAWRMLLEARGDAEACGADAKKAAMAGEMGDWFWWYGRDYESPVEGVFDRLFREKVFEVYKLCPPATYDYTWPLNEPVHFRSGKPVDWAGAPFRALVLGVQELPARVELEVYSSTAGTAEPGRAPGIRTVIHWGPVDYFGGPWKDIYFAPMHYGGDRGSNDVYYYNLTAGPGLYEAVFIAQGSNDYFAKPSPGENYRITVLPETDSIAISAEIVRVEVYDASGRLLGVKEDLSGDVKVPAGGRLRVYLAVYTEGGGSVYGVLGYYYVRPDGSPWYRTEVLAEPVKVNSTTTLFATEVSIPFAGETSLWRMYGKAVASNVVYTGEVALSVVGYTATKVIDGEDWDWIASAPTPPGVNVELGELVVSDPAGDNYKYYRPDWGWPPTSSLDFIEVRLAFDDANLYILVKTATLTSIYAPYVMIAIDVTPDNDNDGFDYWLPDWADTKLPWKWDYVIGINYGKGGSVFVYDHSWTPKYVGVVAYNTDRAIIEAAIPLSALPSMPRNGSIRIAVIMFANDYGRTWDPGKYNAYDPETGTYINEDVYASNVYDIAGQTPTRNEVWGGWSDGDYTVNTSIVAVLVDGVIVSTRIEVYS